MKCLLIFPPQWIPINPHLAPAAIQSALVHNGHTVCFRDLNVEFYRTVLSHDFIARSLDEVLRNYNADAEQVAALRQQKQEPGKLPPELERKYSRHGEVSRLALRYEYPFVLSEITEAVKVLRDRERFYDPAILDAACGVIRKSTEVLSSLFYPSRVYFLQVLAKLYYNIDELKSTCCDRDSNVFLRFYETVISDLLADEPEFIGISLGDYTQLLPGLTLAMLVKSRSDAHLCIGGNLFGRHTDVLSNDPDFFRLFADSIIYNEGERPLLALLAHLRGETPVETVPNLIYLAGGEVKINGEADPLGIDELSTPDYTGFPLHLYYTPEVVFNLQASRSCYWKKCSFCTHHFGSRYAVKSVDKVVGEMRALKQQLGATYFHFVDEAISPAYLARLSQAILKEGLKVYFYIYARFEKEFSPDLFRQAYASGLRLILWGFESANERVYRLMNKGGLAACDERIRLVRSAFEAGIWNHLFVMFGFPSETREEALETIHCLRDQRHMASHALGSEFVLLDKSPILSDPRKYSIAHVERFRSGFIYAHRFKTDSGMDASQVKELRKYKAEAWRLPDLKYKDSAYREKLFLYVCKFGAEHVSEMNRAIWL